MDIEHDTDGTLLVLVEPARRHPTDEGGRDASGGSPGDASQAESGTTTRHLRPGEVGYDEALAVPGMPGLPATVVTTPAGVIARINWLPVSAT